MLGDLQIITTDSDDKAWEERKRGKLKESAKKFLTTREIIGKKGKELVRIPLPHLDNPTHRYGRQGQGGVGQGEGDVGTPLAPGDPQQGTGKAGELPGDDHLIETEISFKELAKTLFEELELPPPEPKGKRVLTQLKDKYNTIAFEGPEGLRHFKRTYKQALKRQQQSGAYDPENPIVIPEKSDKRYKSWTTIFEPEAAALIVFMMDISGSMGEEQKAIVRITAFWIESWLTISEKYKNVEIIYIVHDAAARLVDSETFYHTRESGGTKISSAYNEFAKLINPNMGARLGDKKMIYSPEEWNIYGFHFSDGDNWGGGDTKLCMEILEKKILPQSNLFGYFQVHSAYGAGEFKKDLDLHLGDYKDKEKVKTTDIASDDSEAIFDALKNVLGKKK